MRRLSLERIDVFQLHRIDPDVPLADQVGELLALQREGEIRHIGLSEVTVAELEAARSVAPGTATVQNLYNLTSRQSEEVLEHCEAAAIGFMPWAPVAEGKLAMRGGPLDSSLVPSVRRPCSSPWLGCCVGPR